jgi:hypothetical protein
MQAGICNTCHTAEGGTVDDLEQLAEEYNGVLESIVSKVKKNRHLRAKLNFSIQRKKAPRWETVYEFRGPDLETVSILQEYRVSWTQDPALFLTLSLAPLQGISHPLAFAGGQCLWWERQDAWGAMIRRAHLVNFSKVQKGFDLSIEGMAEILQPYFPSYTKNELIDKGKELLRRGSVLETFAEDICAGAIFGFGREFTDLCVL